MEREAKKENKGERAAFLAVFVCPEEKVDPKSLKETDGS